MGQMSEFKIIDLPKDLLEAILQQEQISIRDVLNFAATCKASRKIEWNEEFWKIKFLQRFALNNIWLIYLFFNFICLLSS